MNELIVDCPICNKKVPWSKESPYRPFCSERCKILDLGAWADGNRTIPSDADNDDVTSADLGKYD